jgi:threonine-phosphate decarboxylase
MIKGHGGNINQIAVRYQFNPSELIDMSSNMNPFGPPEGLNDFLKNNIDLIHCLPEPDAATLCRSLAEKYSISEKKVLAGNGTTQFIYLLPHVLSFSKALIVAPTYSDYADACRLSNVPCDFFFTNEEDDFKINIPKFCKAIEPCDAVYICNPNNPTGTYLEEKTLEKICSAYPDKFFIIDESYLPFCRDNYSETAVHFNLPNVIVFNSMSKIFRIPGLRIGFLIGPEKITSGIAPFIQPWSVNGLSQAAVQYILNNNTVTHSFLVNSRKKFSDEKNIFINRLGACKNIKIFNNETYFILAKLTGKMMAAELFDSLCKEKIVIRDCSNFTGLSDKFVRFSLKDTETNIRLAQKLNALLC